MKISNVADFFQQRKKWKSHREAQVGQTTQQTIDLDETRTMVCSACHESKCARTYKVSILYVAEKNSNVAEKNKQRKVSYKIKINLIEIFN